MKIAKLVGITSEHFIFQIMGGEPTAWRDLKKFHILVKEIAAENNVTAIIEILTNGSRTIRWWRSNYQLFDTIKITHHSEFADPYHTKELAEFLDEQNIVCSVQVPMIPDHWDTCIEHIKILSDSNCINLVAPFSEGNITTSSVISITDASQYI